jgi:polyhydroxyalkanoate synthesis regulator phasin
MLEDIKKALLAGLGGVVLTRDKLEEWKNRLVREDRMSEKEATKLIDDLVKAGESQWKDLEGSLHDMVKKRFDKMNLADRRELETLRARVDALELRLAALERSTTTPEKIL